MTSEAIIDVLTIWRDLLKDISTHSFNIHTEEPEILATLEKRQEVIAQIQKLDDQLRQISDLRQEKWPQIDLSIATRAEKIILEGRSLCDTIAKENHQLIDIAKEKRLSILSKLRDSHLGKGYLSASHRAHIRPPVIVDSNA
ncbi:MAG: hypothetical protein QNJ97_01225 [Myxococcota bacterium]|nr:hypothetical protein [Myxococcota bacterium]